MKATIASSIMIRVDDVPYSLLTAIRSALAISSEREPIELHSTKAGSLVLPRGFAHSLQTLADQQGVPIEWDSHMIARPPSANPFRGWRSPALRDYQAPMRDAMLDWAQGCFQMPTGGGKTICTLDFCRWAGQRTLVVVGKTSLMRQWIEAADEQFGCDPGIIGEGEWIERDLTVCTWQTLHSRRNMIPESFWTNWGAVVFDEVQHVGSTSLYELAGRFPAFYRVGVSATPRWDEGAFPLVRAVVGPVVHVVTDADVGDRLVTPSVRVVPTAFEADYRSWGKANNYGEVMGELSADEDRNLLVAGIALREAEEGHHVLVTTRRREHVRRLVKLMETELRLGSRLHVLTGSQSGHDADRVRRSIEASDRGTVLVATVADEGFDCPRLDRIVFAFPLRKLPLVEQQMGRVRRPHGGKSDAVVYDLADERVGVLRSQLKQRMGLYQRRRWNVSREGEK